VVGLVLLAVATSGPLVSQEPATEPVAATDVLRQAEEAFAEGVRLRDNPDQAHPLFRRSADLFEDLRQRGAANATLFRNQGNACLLADDLPGAILAYRRGLRLAPNDSALQQLLASAREQAIYPPQSGAFARPPVESRPPWLPRLTVRTSFLLVCAVYTPAWVFLMFWLTRRRSIWRSLGIALLIVAAVLLASMTADEIRERNLDAQPLAVIARDDVVLRKGNGEGYLPRHNLPVNRGVEARLLFERDDWVQIELSGGETGWVPRASVLIDQA
jgi:hypothetical protein